MLLVNALNSNIFEIQFAELVLGQDFIVWKHGVLKNVEHSCLSSQSLIRFP